MAIKTPRQMRDSIEIYQRDQRAIREARREMVEGGLPTEYIERATLWAGRYSRGLAEEIRDACHRGIRLIR